MGEVHQETGLMMLIMILAISVVGILRLKYLLGVSIEQFANLLWAALISGSVVSVGVYI